MNTTLPLDWDELKRRRVDFDDHCCAECGRNDVLFVVSTNGEFGLGDLETRCYEHAPNGWKVQDAVVRTDDGVEPELEDDGESVSESSEDIDDGESSVGIDDVPVGEDGMLGGEVIESDDSGFTGSSDVGSGIDAGVDWVDNDGALARIVDFVAVDGDLRDSRYPDSGGYQGFWYPWMLVRWMLGVLVVASSVAVAGGIAAAGFVAGGLVTVEELTGFVGTLGVFTPVEWVVGLFAVVYLPYLLRRDYGDAHWPAVRWIPMDQAVLRRYSEAVVLMIAGGSVLIGSEFVGVDWSVVAAGEVAFLIGLALGVVRMNYLTIRGALFDEYEGRAFVWEWSMRVVALLAVVSLIGWVRIPVVAVVVLAVLVSVGFGVVAHRDGARWKDPGVIGEAGSVDKVQSVVWRGVARVKTAIAPVVTTVRAARKYVGKAIRNDR